VLESADPETVSPRAIERGLKQVGTLGSGNHFLEVSYVDEVFDPAIAQAFGLWQGQTVVLIHSGSRGLGYQVCSDYLEVMERAARKYDIRLPDRQLACAPIRSPEGERYFAAMSCAANYAWANRQCITELVRRSFQQALGMGARDLGMSLVYDNGHNIAKFEEHTVGGKRMRVCVHRKGATRAFGPGHPQVASDHKDVGQPVIIPGDMGTASYVCAGTQRAMEETFGTSAHGAGRMMSRSQAKKRARGRGLHREMEDRGVYVRSTGRDTLAEEMPEAYKDVGEVVDAICGAGLVRKVARFRPIGVVKG
jgi:tRNA-splicing ligase RtcB